MKIFEGIKTLVFEITLYSIWLKIKINWGFREILITRRKNISISENSIAE